VFSLIADGFQHVRQLLLCSRCTPDHAFQAADGLYDLGFAHRPILGQFRCHDQSLRALVRD
jgi:hypothetical protein